MTDEQRAAQKTANLAFVMEYHRRVTTLVSCVSRMQEQLLFIHSTDAEMNTMLENAMSVLRAREEKARVYIEIEAPQVEAIVNKLLGEI